jgi:hypothetical protein
VASEADVAKKMRDVGWQMAFISALVDDYLTSAHK